MLRRNPLEAGTLTALTGSVGQGGANDPGDVQAVQLLLTDWRTHNGRSAIGIDGLVGQETIGAIIDFQKVVTGIVDGRVDPGGNALTALERSHLHSIIMPDPDLVVEPDMLSAAHRITLESLEANDDPDLPEGPAVIKFSQMLRSYFRELRNG